MSTVEARTHEALHDVVDSLGVTDDDVARMEAELLTALARPRRLTATGGTAPTRRRWGLAAAAVVLAAAVAGGIALSSDDREPARPAGQPVSDQPLVPADLVGTWQNVPDSPWVWEFTVDGRMRAVDTAAAYLEGVFGNQLLSRTGDVYNVRDEEGCQERWRITTLRPGAAAIAFLTSSCRQLELPDEENELLLERISAEPYLGGELSVPPVVETPGFVIEKYFIDGVWLHAGTGTVLAVGSPWGGGVLRYVLDDDGDGDAVSDPDQRGRVTVPDSGVPVFQPDAGQEKACVLTFTTNRMTREVMTSTSAPGGCLPGPGPHTWVRIS